MCPKTGRLLFGLWLFVNGLLIVTNKFGEKPMETFSRMTSLISTIANISAYRKYADCIYTTMGALYIAAGVHVLHAGRLSSFIAVLLTVFCSMTFDNPLFSDHRKRDKVVMLLAHLVICAIAISICGDKEVSPEPKPKPEKEKKAAKKEEKPDKA